MSKTEIVLYVRGLETALLKVRDYVTTDDFDKIVVSAYNEGNKFFDEMMKTTSMSIEKYLFALQRLHFLASKYLSK